VREVSRRLRACVRHFDLPPTLAPTPLGVLGAHRLECVSGWYSGRLAGRPVEEEIRAVESHLRLLAESGAAVKKPNKL